MECGIKQTGNVHEYENKNQFEGDKFIKKIITISAPITDHEN